ncbi:MAG TPA: hypothetical protein ENN13_02780 [Candidatus Altiarchaeales archaeon]|nr:hypothetical protein [Candidatus Altiarchaeales archaeon]
MSFGRMIISGIVGGIAATVLSLVPIVNWCEMCFLISVFGGFIAAWFYAKKCEVSIVSGILAGAWSGIFKTLLIGIVSLAIAALLGSGVGIMGIFAGANVTELVAMTGIAVGTSVAATAIAVLLIAVISAVAGAVGGAIYAATCVNKPSSGGKKTVVVNASGQVQ